MIWTIGQVVMYCSSTHKADMKATIEAVHEGSGQVDLDVKKNVKLANIRPYKPVD